MNEQHVALLKAIIRLGVNNDFQIFKEHLESELEYSRKMLPDIVDEVSLRLMQGRAQALKAIVEIVDNAKTTLDAIDDQNTREGSGSAYV